MELAVIEQEYQDIVNHICIAENETPAKLRLKHLKSCGRYHTKTHSISVPFWAGSRGIEYAWWYVIHESIHAIGYGGHGKAFKAKETYWLNQFGLNPLYAKAYVKQLLSLNGEVLYIRPKY